jgi:hypothetical protein
MQPSGRGEQDGQQMSPAEQSLFEEHTEPRQVSVASSQV